MTLTRRDLLRRSGWIAGAAAFWQPEFLLAATAGGDPDPDIRRLRRFSFGIHPEDLKAVQARGLADYLQDQLLNGGPDPAVEGVLQEALPSVFADLDTLNEQLESEAIKPAQVAQELRLATTYRAIHSKYQLYEVMVDFWSNHFNICNSGSTLRVLKTVDDREVIRPHALGTFRALLHASARSPAMLVYLNNASSKKSGFNENYARELMELHTVGVDGGYHHEDVQEVARILTGWTVHRRGALRGRFRFDSRMHDYGEKQVMGVLYPAGIGLEEGEQLLDQLVDHPSTARFIALKLCQRFVSDQPPETLVDKVAAAWGTDGDIRAMLIEIITSDDILQPEQVRFRRPNDFIYGMLRTSATAISPKACRVALYGLKQLDQRPFDYSAPTGYPAAMSAWLSSCGLLNRWNLASQALGFRSSSPLPGRKSLIRPEQFVPDTINPESVTDALVTVLLQDQIDDSGRSALHAHARALAQTLDSRHAVALPRTMASLIFASPYFQWL